MTACGDGPLRLGSSAIRAPSATGSFKVVDAVFDMV